MKNSKYSKIYLGQRTRKHDKNEAGFSLIEIMIVVFIIGMLSAIAAPGWNAFVNRQRTRTVNDAVFQALRKAQSQAKLKKEDIQVKFYSTEATDPTDPPAVEIENFPEEKLNANGEIKAGMIKLIVKECKTPNADGTCATYQDDTDITFNYLGAVESTQNLPFSVIVSTENDGFKRCVIVETLLGSMRTAEGEFNSDTGAGCP